MFSIALKRVWNRTWLTLLSIVGVALAVGLVAAAPIFSKSVSFVMLQEELRAMASKTGRPIFSMRVYVLPAARFPLPLSEVRTLGGHIQETLTTEVGLPLRSTSWEIHTTGLVIRTRDKESPYEDPNVFLRGDINLLVMPGIEERLDYVQGESMLAVHPVQVCHRVRRRLCGLEFPEQKMHYPSSNSRHALFRGDRARRSPQRIAAATERCSARKVQIAAGSKARTRDPAGQVA